MKKIESILNSILLILSNSPVPRYRNFKQWMIEISIFLLLFTFISVFLLVSHISKSSYPDMDIHFLNVGQGDATLIKTPEDKRIIIDGGPDNSIIHQISDKITFLDKKIDLIILSHPHEDHLNGLISVMENFDVMNIMLTAATYNTPSYDYFLKKINEQEINLILSDKDQTLYIEKNLSIEIIYPQLNFALMNEDDLNDTSVVLKLVYGKSKVLFTGDISSELEEEIIDYANLESDILKIPHHGSSGSNSKKFIESVNPKYAVIMVGDNNQFNHPSPSTVETLTSRDICILRTDWHGGISFSINPQKLISLKSENIKNPCLNY